MESIKNKIDTFIGYGDSAADCLRMAVEKKLIAPVQIYASQDDLTQGPLPTSSDFEMGRINYWNQILNYLDEEISVEEEFKNNTRKLRELRGKNIALIVGDSCHDYLMTAWLISNLNGNNWYISLLDKPTKDNLPPVNLAMFTLEEFPSLVDDLKEINDSELSYFTSLWDKVIYENGSYRIKSESTILNVSETYHDSFILEFINDQYQSSRKIIRDIIKSSGHSLSDLTISYRMKRLIELKVIDCDGNFVYGSDNLLRISE